MDTSRFKTALLEEKKRLTEELGHLGKRTGTKDHWETTLTDPSQGSNPDESMPEADPLDAAVHIEQYEERFSMEKNLEKRLQEVDGALERMAAGSYGTCTTDGASHPIEEGRLMANPAAATCTTHA